MKTGILPLALICCSVPLSGCSKSPVTAQHRDNADAARTQLFLQCVEIVTRSNDNQYRDNASVVEQCRISSQQLI